MAKQYAYDTSLDALLHPDRKATFFEQWSAGDYVNEDLLCAEMSRLAYAKRPQVKNALAVTPFDGVTFIGGNDPAGRPKFGGTQGFVATSSKLNERVLAFRGTESDRPEDILTDLLTLPGPPAADGSRVHAGFQARAHEVANQTKRALDDTHGRLTMTGHSLGAALATLAALEVRPDKLITFGSPRIGDPRFGQRFEGIEVHRFVDCCDVVARVPPERFDVRHLLQLFTELMLGDPAQPVLPLEQVGRNIAEGSFAIAAAVIASGFQFLNPDIEFAHIAPPIYLTASGKSEKQASGDEIARDQAAARSAYPFRFDTDRFREFFVELSGASRIAHKDLTAALGASLLRLFGVGQVPSRDLADHAPINYLSALTGRLCHD